MAVHISFLAVEEVCAIFKRWKKKTPAIIFQAKDELDFRKAAFDNLLRLNSIFRRSSYVCLFHHRGAFGLEMGRAPTQSA